MESGSDWSFAGGMKGNPELFSRYDVLERIGEGTFGEVYKGRRKVDGLIVAMKETRDPQCSSRELEALMVLAHPNVVKLIEYFLQGPNLVLVLEYLPTDLAQVIQESERPLRESEIKGWMLQILAGVAACHRASILHRDLKPSNMLVGADGSLKVADFGQARTVYEEDGSNWPSDPCMVGAFDWTAGHEGVLFNAEKVNSSSSMNCDVGSECKNTWICGTDSLNSTVDLAGEGKKHHHRGTHKTLKDYFVKDCIPLEEEGLVKDCLETLEQDGCGCFCSESVDDKTQVHGPDGEVKLQVGGCRSLSCKAGKAGYLIHVVRSNHFAGVDRVDDISEESSRRDWVLTEEDLTEVGLGSSREKDNDFFYKVRSFIKRRGRILHKQGKGLSPSRNGKGDTRMVVATSTGEEGVTHVGKEVLSGTALRDIDQKEASVPVNSSDLINHEGIAVEKQDERHMNDLGIRPLMGDEICAADPGLIKLMPKFKEDACCDVEKDVFEPNETGSGDVEIGRGDCKQCSGSGSASLSCVTHGNVAQQLDTGSELKRRKANKYESATEEVAPALRRDEPLGECNSGVEDDKHPVEAMEIDAQITELEIVRNRILYGKHGRSGVQKRDAHVPTNPDYAVSHNHVELPPANLQLDPALDASGSKSITLGVEKGQGTTWALAGSVDKNITRFTKEFQSEEDPSVLAEGKQQRGETVHFWDGSRQHGRSADDVSEGHRGGNENWNNANWSGDVAREDGNGLNGCFDEHGSNLEGLRETAGCNQINGTEDWNFAVETRWYRPPDVYDSYVKHGGQNDNVDGERRTGIGSQVLIGEPESGMPSRLNRSDMGYDFRFHETGVHSQQKGIDSTGSSEIGDQNSELSPFVGTLWYKAPELLYGARKYGKALDMWAVGCIFAELLGGKPLFPGITDIDQLSRVVRVLGAPNEKVWPGISQLHDFDKISFHDERAPLPFQKLLPHASPSSLRFLKKFLVYDPAQRLSAEAALGDSYFQEDPLPLRSTLKELPFLTSRRDSSASEDWAEWRDPGSPFSDFEILDSAP